ncbi:MAG: TMEM165/GDT1 family protein [Candidatus Korarchaeota archaeon]|nr:TMEM165/GDT1 family protein [Candidatus Korarchaeota archaeon]NIU83310.1 TMEM165/GDT1 family protein [Candidatus Thorarchaeota archaeon]NIW13645.1 TMEM165/GDT1 family protein [Candidatus Thorarchaeota archaeon]NIW51748.1 TMEM165/GDT1 family protein [Candidatus Korarchaeota archaeon]
MEAFFSSLSIAFSLLFLTELGDKTQLLVISLALQEDSRVKLAIGATFGFLAIVTLGGVFASIISQFLPISWISLGSGIIFVILGGYQLERRLRLKNDTREADEGVIDFLPRNSLIAGFLGIFIMELGDKTQVMTILLATQSPSFIGTLCGAWVALSLLAFIGAFTGSLISKKLPKEKIEFLTAFLFIIVGVFAIIMWMR